MGCMLCDCAQCTVHNTIHSGQDPRMQQADGMEFFTIRMHFSLSSAGWIDMHAHVPRPTPTPTPFCPWLHLRGLMVRQTSCRSVLMHVPSSPTPAAAQWYDAAHHVSSRGARSPSPTDAIAARALAEQRSRCEPRLSTTPARIISMPALNRELICGGSTRHLTSEGRWLSRGRHVK